MYSDPFALLGLDPNTATDADVRKAYAARLKVTRPEDDREGFMALRAAFEDARSEVRARELYGPDIDDEDQDEEQEREQEEVTVTEMPASDAPAVIEAPDIPPEAPYLSEPEVETGANSADEETFDDEDDDDYFTEADRHLDAAMAALQAALQDPWGAKSGERALAIVEAPEVSGIDEYQALQWRVRDWLCNETGYFADPQNLAAPAWLSLAELEALDTYFGWTAQPSRQAWIRDKNDWMLRLKEQVAWNALPEKVRKQREKEKQRGNGQTGAPQPGQQGYLQDKTAQNKKGGGMFWFWVGFGILAINILRALG